MRRKVFQQTLPQALALADRVVLGGVFRAQQLGEENRMEPEAVAESVRELGKSARVFPSADAIAEQLGTEAEVGDLLLVMSNGSFDGLCEKMLVKLGQPVPGFFRGKYQVRAQSWRGRAMFPTTAMFLVCALCWAGTTRRDDPLRGIDQPSRAASFPRNDNHSRCEQ